MHACRAINKSNCFHWHGHDADCTQNTGSYIVGFGVVQVIFSHIFSSALPTSTPTCVP